MTVSSLLAGLALLLAAGALLRARAVGRRADRLAESYWELRYEAGQLRSRITQLEVASGLREAPADAPDDSPRPAQTTTFVPLSSLKK